MTEECTRAKPEVLAAHSRREGREREGDYQGRIFVGVVYKQLSTQLLTIGKVSDLGRGSRSRPARYDSFRRTGLYSFCFSLMVDRHKSGVCQ